MNVLPVCGKLVAPAGSAPDVLVYAKTSPLPVPAVLAGLRVFHLYAQAVVL